jgi:hypothetical protein
MDSKNKKVASIPLSALEGSFVDRSRYLYNIRTEDNETLGYEVNEAQKYLNGIIQEEYARSTEQFGVPQCKLVVLKARQVGITTDTACRIIDGTIGLNMAHALIMAHEEKSTEIIFDKYKLLYQELPDEIVITGDDGNPMMVGGKPMTVSGKPDTNSDSGYRLSFKTGSKGRIFVRTAGSRDNVGRGDTLNFVHLSEYSRYPAASTTLKAINQGIPKNAQVYAIIESTANGVSGEGEDFYKLWVKSIKGWADYEEGKSSTFSGWRPVFIPWYWMSKYTRQLIDNQMVSVEDVDFGSQEAKNQFFEREDLLRKDYGITDEQLNWYRWAVIELCDYDYATMLQEYPTFWQDAFLASDTGVFNNDKLIPLEEQMRVGLAPKVDTGYLDEDMKFISSRSGKLKIKEFPNENWINRYIISLDQSTGKEGGDNAVMSVWDRLERKFVAQWVGLLEEDLLAQEYINLCTFYNEGLAIPESNLATVINLIKPEGFIPYTGPLYIRTNDSTEKQEYGFRTDRMTKKMLVDNYLSYIRENYTPEWMFDLDTVKEHITFVRKPKNGHVKYEASEGNHDDRVVGRMLACWGDAWWDEKMWCIDTEKSSIYDLLNKPIAVRRNPIRQSGVGKTIGFKQSRLGRG